MHIPFIYHSYTQKNIAFTYHSHTIQIPFAYHSHTIHIPFIYHSYTIHIPFTYHSYTIHIPFTYHSYAIHVSFTYHSYTIPHQASVIIHLLVYRYCRYEWLECYRKLVSLRVVSLFQSYEYKHHHILLYNSHLTSSSPPLQLPSDIIISSPTTII